MNEENKFIIKETIICCITAMLALLIIIAGIAIPCLISEKRNIEKEITLKQIEIYGEEINLDE